MLIERKGIWIKLTPYTCSDRVGHKTNLIENPINFITVLNRLKIIKYQTIYFQFNGSGPTVSCKNFN